ncbi:MAG: (d)CMP kinase [Rhodobacteraceae bacterium]|nr:(d)CMP kinase [Paracoccaceae bacterium]
MDSSTPASRARHLARVAATVERLVPGRTSGRLRRLPFLGRRDGPAAGSARLAETGTRRQDGSDQDGGRRVQGSFTIAIDGPAASGKGTISRALAEKFGLAHLDTGLLYRATGAKVADGMAPITAAEGLMPADLERGDLRSAEAGQAASRVAAIPEVRTALVDFQRRFARRQGGAVLDGRDIGTVICPEAEVKLYVVADDETRAKRRFAELAASNPELTLSTVLEDLRARDRRDSERAASPLKPAEDALVLDTTRMSIDEAVEAAAAAVVARMPG